MKTKNYGLIVLLFFFLFPSCKLKNALISDSILFEKSNLIVGSWTCNKYTHITDKNFISTPKLRGYNKRIFFTKDGKITTYKNNVEIRISDYKIFSGIGNFDKLKHDLITFDGGTYVIEELNNNILILLNNSTGYRTFYKK